MKIAIDLGGTNIRCAIVEKTSVRDKISVPCKSGSPEDEVVDQISGLISDIINESVDGIGIGVPSVVDPERGIVYNAANIPSWKEVHLKEKLESRFGLPVRVNNDCNCFALGEFTYGAGKGCKDVVGITLGTGVGAGLILDGRLYSGRFCGAGEVGSLPYLDSDYEHYCSSLWLSGACKTNGADLAAKAKEGDSESLEIWRQFGHNLGELTKAILFAYAPEMLIVGGGISAAMPYFRQGWQETLDTFPYKEIAAGCRMERAMLADANLLGAALLF